MRANANHSINQATKRLISIKFHSFLFSLL
jgi:hypothetical protein